MEFYITDLRESNAMTVNMNIYLRFPASAGIFAHHVMRKGSQPLGSLPAQMYLKMYPTDTLYSQYLKLLGYIFYLIELF